MTVKGTRKFWDGQDESTITEEWDVYCDSCGKRQQWIVGEFFTIPPDGASVTRYCKMGEITEKEYYEHFICIFCIEEYAFEYRGNDLPNLIRKYRKTNEIEDEKYVAWLYREAQEYLPQIFRLKRPYINKKLRNQILGKYGYTCVYCGSDENLAIDHKTPYSRGGSNKAKNLQAICKSCNSKKHDKTAKEFKEWRKENAKKKTPTYIIVDRF